MLSLTRAAQRLTRRRVAPCDEKASAALDALLSVSRAAEAMLSKDGAQVYSMADSNAARRRGWHPVRSVVLLALAGWRGLRRKSAASAAVAGAGALAVGSFAVLPLVTGNTPAHAQGAPAVRVHHHRGARPAAVTVPLAGHAARRHRRHAPPPGGTASGTPVLGHQPATPSQPAPPPQHSPLPPVTVPVPAPVGRITQPVLGKVGQIAAPVLGTVGGVLSTVTGVAGGVTGTAGDAAGTVTGTVGAVAGDAGDAAAPVLGTVTGVLGAH